MNEDFEMDNKQQEYFNLLTKLTSATSPIGDWKVAKYQEYVAAGEQPPYDIASLHSQRQAVRDKINALKAELGM